MPPIFTSTYVILGIIGGLLVLLMAILVFFVMVVSLLIGGCYGSYQTRKFHPTFASNRRRIMITSLPPTYSNSDIAPMVRLQGMEPSTRFIQDGESEDSNSAGSSRNSNSIGQCRLPAPPKSSNLIHNRRYHASSSQRSDGHFSRSEGRNRTRASVLLSGDDSRSERQNRNRRRRIMTMRGSQGICARASWQLEICGRVSWLSH